MAYSEHVYQLSVSYPANTTHLDNEDLVNEAVGPTLYTMLYKCLYKCYLASVGDLTKWVVFGERLCPCSIVENRGLE